MAITAQKSTQVAVPDTRPVALLHPAENKGKLRLARIDFAQSGAGDIGSTVDLVKLPAGKVRVYAGLSRIATSAFGASRTLSIGHTGWTKTDGTAQAAVAAAFDSAKDVSSAVGYAPSGALTAAGDLTLAIEGRDEVTIQAVVAGGTIPDGATINGYIAYVRD